MLNIVITAFQNIKSKFQKSAPLLVNNNKQIEYTALSPVTDADPDYKYTDALIWAFENTSSKSIKNIAVTGPYGSGKSSVIKTLQKRLSDKKHKFLNISLATFKDENMSPAGADKTETLRLIESSILQQIFYHEKDETIPDSRFKKITPYNKNSILLYTICWFLLSTSIIYLKYPDLKKYIPSWLQPNDAQNTLIQNICFIIILLGSIILINKSIRALSKIKLNKFNLFDTEIQIGEKDSKSILNQHIDEITYFFEVTQYNIVVIEDLDRFNQTEIFTKLREINQLLNNSKKINRDIIFIYAVRDDMFQDKDRAKFFDFIIPIIPVINSSNSSQKLIEKRKANKYLWSDDLIEDLALFINDMRLLHNITNEFHLYKLKQSSSLDQNKLLAILVYKNIFPSDFAALSTGSGYLYDSINNKKEYIAATLSKVESQISDLKNEIKRIEDIGIKNENELRALYVLAYIPYCPGITSFTINGQSISIENMVLEDNFDYLISDRALYNNYQGNYNYPNTSINITFKSIEKKVDPKYDYNERLINLLDAKSKKNIQIKNEITKLEEEKNLIRNSKVKELLMRANYEVELPSDNMKQLINVLLRNGYIDEDYQYYISIFYEGTLTKKDYQFLLNVKSNIGSPFDYKLDNIDHIIKRIHISHFIQDSIFNFQILDFLIKNNQYEAQRNLLFSKLSDESESSIRILDSVIIDRVDLVQPLFNLIGSKWPNIWSFIITKSNFPPQKINTYFSIILNYININDLKKINNLNSFIKHIQELEDLDNILVADDRLIEITRELSIKFQSLTIKPLDNNIFQKYIYENNHYIINVHMLKTLIKEFGHFNQADFDLRNYYAVINSKCTKLISYINKNIQEYVDSVYLKIETNKEENENTLIELLNNESINRESKTNLIKRLSIKITKVSSINMGWVKDLLLSQNSIFANWENIYNYYNEIEALSDELISFINTQENINELSSTKIPKGSDEDKDLRSIFITDLLASDDLNDSTYELLLKSVPYTYDSLDITSLSEIKIAHLVNYKILECTNENFSTLKNVFTSKRFHIQLLEKHSSEFIKNLNNIKLDTYDIAFIIISNSFSLPQKSYLLNTLEEDIITKSANTLRVIGELLVANPSISIRDEILKKILLVKSLSSNRRVYLFNSNFKILDQEEITSFLQSLEEPFSNITIKRKKPALEFTEENLKLTKILHEIGYISSFDQEKDQIRIYTFNND